MRILGTLLFTCIFFISVNGQGDPEVKGSLNSGTLEEQFNYMVAKSNRYQDFKVIKQTWLHTYWSHVADSLSQLHGELNANQSQIAKQSNTISDLEEKLSIANGSLDTVNQEKESISFLGAGMDKGLYKKIMWGVAFGLLGLLLLTLIRFKSSKSITKSTKLRLAEIEEEFDSHKRRALEKEQQLKRELQDQINKMDGMNPSR